MCTCYSHVCTKYYKERHYFLLIISIILLISLTCCENTISNKCIAGALSPLTTSSESMSEALKIMKTRMLKKVLDTLNIDQCIIFCRTNFDCDNVEKFLNNVGGGQQFRGIACSTLDCSIFLFMEPLLIIISLFAFICLYEETRAKLTHRPLR